MVGALPEHTEGVEVVTVDTLGATQLFTVTTKAVPGQAPKDLLTDKLPAFTVVLLVLSQRTFMAVEAPAAIAPVVYGDVWSTPPTTIVPPVTAQVNVALIASVLSTVYVTGEVFRTV